MRIIVSLTTVPSRVPYLSQIIDCLSQQTYSVDKIYVNLPYYSRREQCYYPEPQFNLNKNIPVTIVRCPDYGPITKLYPVLQYEQDPETLIITVDDDIQYVPERIEILVTWAKKYPDAAIGGSGFIVGNWWNFFGTIHQPKIIIPVSVVEGYSGCVYRRKFFNDDLIDYSDAPKESFYHDDVWISGYLAKQGIKRLVHPWTNSSNKWGSSGYGKEEHLPNGLSQNTLSFAWKIIPVLLYFKQQGFFDEEQVALPIRTFGFWFLILFLIIIIVYLLIKPW